VADRAFHDALLGDAGEFGLNLPPSTLDRFEEHFRLLLLWNRKINLTRITDPAEAARRHFLESAFLSTLVPAPPRLVDVGSGAGFPGVPLACVWPATEMTLVEPLAKRAIFLKEVARALGLDRVRVRNARFDPAEVNGETLVVARALDRFHELLDPLLSSSAFLVALFSEPNLLDAAAACAPQRDRELVALPGTDRRFVGLFRLSST
jgi:16S rRNA (guanine527-N7)-methyltransferase